MSAAKERYNGSPPPPRAAESAEITVPGGGTPPEQALEIAAELLRDPSLLASFLLAAVAELDAPCGVAACGLLCAGKSTLLNALTGRTGQAYFATGAGRTTHACKSLDDGAGFRWIDTPGLDVSGEDDAEAEKAIRTADTLLFVHHPGTGELHKAEAAFLRGVAAGAETRHSLAERLCVALTHKESLPPGELGRLGDAVRRQVESATGADPALFPVSSTVYLKGAREARPQLVELSGVPALRTHLARGAEGVSARRWKRIGNIEDELHRRIDAEIAHRAGRRRTLDREIAAVEKMLRGEFGSFLAQLDKRLAGLDA